MTGLSKYQLLNEILAVLASVKEDKTKLEKIHQFLMNEIYEDVQEDEIEIPEDFRKIVKAIAESIDCGMICFLNPDTLEVIEIPKDRINELNFEFVADDDEEDYTTDFDDELKKLDEWKQEIRFDTPSSDESFSIMKAFASQLSDKKLQDLLFKVLGRSHPFANFKNIIDQSKYRQQWFGYKQKAMEINVFKILQDKLFKN